MMSSIPPLKYTVPPFMLLSVAGLYFIVIQMALSHAPERFLEVHKASHVPLAVTHVTALDKILTPLVSFFVSAFGDPSSHSYSTVVDFVWSFGAAIQLPLIEAQRSGLSRHSLLAYPMIWGILYQRVSGGWILPLWLLVFMRSRTRAEGAGVEQAKAESVFAGWWLGHTLPALAMLVPGLPAFTHAPGWIAFPILMTFFQRLYLFLRTHAAPLPVRTHAQSTTAGHRVLQYTYLSVFAASCAAHLHVVIIPGLKATPSPSPLSEHIFGLARFLFRFYVPSSISTPSPATTTADSGVEHFVQWDVLVVFAAVWIAGIWDLALRRQDATYRVQLQFILGTFASLFFGALALGPGAATAALWMYREDGLEKARNSTNMENGIKPYMDGPMLSYTD